MYLGRILVRELKTNGRGGCQELKHHAVDYRGSIKVFASTVPAQYILPNIIGNFQKKFSLAYFSVIQEPSERVYYAVLEGRADAGFLGAKFDNEKLRYISAAEDQLVLILPKEEKRDSNKVTIEEILEMDMVLRNPGSGTQKIFEIALTEAGFPCRI